MEINGHQQWVISLQSVQMFCKMAKKDNTLLRMNFNALSVESIPNFMPDFILS